MRDDYSAQLTDYQQAQGILRLEAKYGAAMLQKHFGITDLSYSPELLYRFLQESSCILCKAMQDCFPAGTYYSLAAVQEQLAQAGKSVQRKRLRRPHAWAAPARHAVRFARNFPARSMMR